MSISSDGNFLVIPDGREYEIPNDPVLVLGLLHHLSSKTWVDGSFIHNAIHLISDHRGWKIY